MLSQIIRIVEEAIVTCPYSPSYLSQFSEVCPNTPVNEGFSFCFP